jgi:hypothetical protein
LQEKVYQYMLWRCTTLRQGLLYFNSDLLWWKMRSHHLGREELRGLRQGVPQRVVLRRRRLPALSTGVYTVRWRLCRHKVKRGELRRLRQSVHRRKGVHRRSVQVPRALHVVRGLLHRFGLRRAQLWSLRQYLLKRRLLRRHLWRGVPAERQWVLSGGHGVYFGKVLHLVPVRRARNFTRKFRLNFAWVLNRFGGSYPGLLPRP